MEKFILSMLSFLQSKGIGSEMASCSRAPNVTGGIDGGVFPQTTETQQ